MEKKLEKIEERLAAIKAEIELPDAKLEDLEKEINELQEERKAIKEKVEKRETLLKSVVLDGNVKEDFKEERKQNMVETMTKDEVIASAEYRTAWLKNLQGKGLNDVEKEH